MEKFHCPLFYDSAVFLRLLLICLAGAAMAQDAAAFRKLMRASPKLPMKSTELHVQVPGLDFVSSLAVDREGVIYLFQRALELDPVIAVSSEGKVLRSWGKGIFKIPHSVRVDPEGNIWTVDAASSMIYKFTREGRQLLKIDVGGLPAKPKSAFCGTTDIAFTHGRIFVSDGYANARVIEYDGAGRRVREWGKPGRGAGEFHLPHAIAVDGNDVLYVADRENGRIQRFTLDGKYLGEWNHLGKTFSLKVGADNDLWIGTQPHDVGNGVEPWLVRVDRRSGQVLGAIESGGHHSVEINGRGELMTGARPNQVLWFRIAN